MLRKVFLSTLICLLILLPEGRGPGWAASTMAKGSRAAAFAPGQVLVRFKPNISPNAVTSLATVHGAMQVKRIANRTFTLIVPEGTEEQMVRRLALDPAVQHVSLNYRITEPLAGPLEPAKGDRPPQTDAVPNQAQESCITNLWMSATGQGEPLQDNMLPSETPLVYVFFEFSDCELEAVLIEIFYLGLESAPTEPIFSKEQVISGSGVQGNRVGAWEYFTKTGTFPIGKYVTILSISPEGGWDEARKVWWQVSTFPNDHWFRGTSNYQWPLHSTGKLAVPEADINLPQAWDITTGSPNIIIANVSTGVWIDHPDLKNKIWTNRKEIPDNGLDDDGNGCVDDVHGCEFFNGEATPTPFDVPGGWGTVTSGIAAAETNNEIGMAGISWGTRIMPIKVLRLLPGGILGGYLADLITGIDYAVNNGARIIHIGPRAEGVSEEQLALLRAAIDDAVSRGALVVAGTGNLVDTGEGSGNRVVYPAGFDNVVAVGCTDIRNERCWFSNYWSGIDLVAPGDLVLSTYFSEEYQYIRRSETNLAAAHVEGVAALIWSVNPDLTPQEVRTILQASAVDLGPPGYDEEYGYGKLDANKAVALTPHRLWLRTADPDQLRLVFLLDDQVSQACQTVWNWGTGPQTWGMTPDSEWLGVEKPNTSGLAPVPSDVQVCVNAEALPAYGTFEGKIEAFSTLTRHENPVAIDAIAIYQPELSRVRLSFIGRSGRHPPE